MKETPRLVVHWERALGLLLDHTARFPKTARFTFSTRIDNLGLDIFEMLVEARFARGRRERDLLARADAALLRLRALLRLSFERRFLSRAAFTQLIREADEAGRMLGGWRRSEAADHG